jgi:hypothetical protein
MTVSAGLPPFPPRFKRDIILSMLVMSEEQK